MLCLAAALPSQKTFLHQLLDGSRPGGRRPDTPAFDFFPHIFFPNSLHRGQQGILCEVLGRGRFALFQLGIQNRERFLVLCFCQDIQSFLDLFSGIAKDSPLDDFPALVQNRPDFSREGLSGTLELYRSFGIAVGFTHSGQQSGGDQTQDTGLT